MVYARREVVIPERFADWSRELNARVQYPLIADLPAVGSEIAAGQPICTVFSAGAGEADAERALQALATRVYSLVGDSV